MNAFLNWMTANPVRAFLAAGLASLIALVALPMAAWLPAGVIVLALLASGRAPALAATAGAAIVLVWAFAPLFGAGPAIAIATVALLPSVAAAYALLATRSLGVRVPGADRRRLPARDRRSTACSAIPKAS